MIGLLLREALDRPHVRLNMYVVFFCDHFIIFICKLFVLCERFSY